MSKGEKAGKRFLRDLPLMNISICFNLIPAFDYLIFLCYLIRLEHWVVVCIVEGLEQTFYTAQKKRQKHLCFLLLFCTNACT